jgi:hypothetical protein
MATQFERLEDRINMLRPDANKPEAILTSSISGVAWMDEAERAIRKAYAQGRKDQHRETAALFRGIMAA